MRLGKSYGEIWGWISSSEHQYQLLIVMHIKQERNDEQLGDYWANKLSYNIVKYPNKKGMDLFNVEGHFKP